MNSGRRDTAVKRLRHRISSGAITGLLWLSLAGCAAVANTPSTATPDLQSWQGRFALTISEPSSADTEADGQERAQGRFRLQKQADKLSLALFSPFGQQLANAVSDNHGAVLITAKGQRFEAANPDALIEQALGWRLPVSAMPEWLSGSGLPADDAWIEQKQWKVRVERRAQNGTPSRLAARWPASNNPDARRLVLYIIVDPSQQQ